MAFARVENVTAHVRGSRVPASNGGDRWRGDAFPTRRRVITFMDERPRVRGGSAITSKMERAGRSLFPPFAMSLVVAY